MTNLDEYGQKYTRSMNVKGYYRLCKLCITQTIEDEYHFLIDCPIYDNSRKICYQKISELCSNFNNMSDKSKFYAHNRGKQIAYIDYCHWRQLYIYIYIYKLYINTMFLVGLRALKK
jgi:hypothetical protein